MNPIPIQQMIDAMNLSGPDAVFYEVIVGVPLLSAVMILVVFAIRKKKWPH